MDAYLRAKCQLSSIIVTSFRQGGCSFQKVTMTFCVAILMYKFALILKTLSSFHFDDSKKKPAYFLFPFLMQQNHVIGQF